MGSAMGVLLDIAGVLYEGDRPIPGAVDAVRRLRGSGLAVRYLTNSTRRPKRRIVERLRSLGFPVDPAEILTPAEAACDWLRREGYAPHLLIHPDLEEDFMDLPKSDRIAVVVGDAGPCFSYERMNAAFRELERGAPFLALAINRVFKDRDGKLSLDAGAFVKALEYSSGTPALLLGKPSRDFFVAGARSMGCALGDVTMIGDDAESDVSGAIAAGVRAAIHVQTGKYRAGDETQHDHRPSALARDIAAAVDLLVETD
ncbi:MAG: TIGR01458 family HAD-type hydrolase [Alphaproteobacteria bacterium]|nr:TIGR01458 family HAD-type hydrolase [Alphaproteobacteria bacterium]NNF23459.1 TIGR01458 family HAD-type hydrolase [Paracoccaceae bacterium]